MQIIAHIYTDYKEKFGIPRQSGLVPACGRIVFEKKYRVPEAFRGLEGFSHIWLLWQFSRAVREDWSPTVRPPLLGGNRRLGVFATRSPFRPNPIGLSCVQLERIEYTKDDGPVLFVRGADILDGTPIYDVKPYLPYADAHPEATGGFTDGLSERRLSVQIDTPDFAALPDAVRQEVTEILAGDPRPSYQDSDKIYGMKYAAWEFSFSVAEGVLHLVGVSTLPENLDLERGDHSAP